MRVLAIAVILLHSQTAAADEGEGFQVGAQPSWFVLGGVTTGGTVGIDDKGALIGGELSLARLNGTRYLGFYADGFYDFGPNGWYLTAGPEIGFIRRSLLLPLALGFDGGAALRFVGGDSQIGGAARVSLVVVGAVSIFARYLHFGTDDNEQMVQIGLSLKYPLFSPFGSGAR